MRIKRIIKEELENLANEVRINEILDKPMKTEYEIVKNGGTKTYRFVTTKNNSYDVNFDFFAYENTDSDFDIITNVVLDNYLNDELYIINLAFAPTETNTTDDTNSIVGTKDDPFIKRTDRFEQLEVLPKIIYLVSEFVKLHNIYVYLIGKETSSTSLSVYNVIYNKIFKNDFNRYENDNFYVFIDKGIIK
jgi:hypothetical protein